MFEDDILSAEAPAPKTTAFGNTSKKPTSVSALGEKANG